MCVCLCCFLARWLSSVVHSTTGNSVILPTARTMRVVVSNSTHAVARLFVGGIERPSCWWRAASTTVARMCGLWYDSRAALLCRFESIATAGAWFALVRCQSRPRSRPQSPAACLGFLLVLCVLAAGAACLRCLPALGELNRLPRYHRALFVLSAVRAARLRCHPSRS